MRKLQGPVPYTSPDVYLQSSGQPKLPLQLDTAMICVTSTRLLPTGAKLLLGRLLWKLIESFSIHGNVFNTSDDIRVT